MRVISVDPGYERLGVAVLDGPTGNETYIYATCIQTSPQTPHAKRLAHIHTEFEDLLQTYKPDICASETLYANYNQKTVIQVSESRGVLLAAAANHNLQIEEYTPGQIKAAVTGHGNSDKQQVTTIVQRLVSLPDKKRYDDEYDAIAVGITALASSQAHIYTS